jgi:fermentation-respiration switch protein FrsA (DUF1100 family)
MTVTGEVERLDPAPPSPSASGGGWLPPTLGIAGAAAAVLVAQGSPLGVAVRLLLIGTLTVLATVAVRTMSPRGSGAVAVAAGTVAVVVGLGIGVSFSVRSGLSLRAIAGMVELVAGLVLLVGGSTTLIRRTHGWRRWTAVPIAFVILQFVAVPLFGAVVITNVPPDEVGPTTPADLGLTFEEVAVPAADGVLLAGWYVRSSTGAALVVLAGSGSTRSGALAHAVVLARHGYGTLILDNRGHGRSEGVAMDTGWFGSADIGGAVAFLAQRPDVDPEKIAVVGLSMGGEEAIGAAGEVNGIRAVVAEGATARSDADHLDTGSGVTGAIERITSWEQFRVADLLTDASQPVALVDAARSSHTPMLLIAGRGEVDANRRFRDAAPDRIELWELPDTPHVGALAERPQEWEQRVVTFLDRSLV